MPSVVRLLLVFGIFTVLAASAPAVGPQDSHPQNSAIAPVADTGSYDELFAAAEDPRNQTPISTKIPSKEETAHQIDAYKIKPLTFAHRIEGVLRVVGLEKQTNIILDALCLLAYAYLLRLTSKSRLYIMELIQMLGFFCFPALPLVQFINNTCKLASRALYDGTCGLRYLLACLIGQYATSSLTSIPISFNEKTERPAHPTSPPIRQRLTHVPPHELDFPPTCAHALWHRFAGLIFTLVAATASITTLHIHLDHPVRSDWDSVGIASDQRHGWIAGGATLSSFLSIIALLINSAWFIKPEFSRPDLAGAGLLGESEVFAELALAAVLQDVVGGVSGIDSCTGHLAALTSNRWGLVAGFVLVAVLHKKLVSLVRSFAGQRSVARRGSGASVSKPAASLVAIVVCVVVGGYHVGGQAMMLRAATRHQGSMTGSLSAGMHAAE